MGHSKQNKSHCSSCTHVKAAFHIANFFFFKMEKVSVIVDIPAQQVITKRFGMNIYFEVGTNSNLLKIHIKQKQGFIYQ